MMNRSWQFGVRPAVFCCFLLSLAGLGFALSLNAAVTQINTT